MMINKRLIGLVNDSKKYIKYTVIFNWISLILNIISIFFIGNLLEKVFNKNFIMKDLIITGLVTIIAIIIRVICNIFASKMSYYSSVNVKKVLREKIYNKLTKLGSSYTEKVSTSEVVQVSVEGIEQLDIYFSKYLPQLFYSLLAPLTLFIILSFINFKSALVLLICVPLIPVSIIAVQKFAKKLLNKYWGIYTNLGDSFLENLQGLTTLKIYKADEEKSKKMDEEAENFRKVTMRVLTMQLNSISVMDLIAFGGAALGIIISISEFKRGNINLQGTFAIIMLSSEFFIPLRLLGSFFHIAMNGMAASDKIFKILDLEEDKCKNEEIKENNINITFKDIKFSYEESREILKGVSMDIKNRSFISIVGESGCGKSTIASIITKNNKNYEGSIKINNKELSNISEESIMKNITLVNHNSYLFKGTVEENLKMAKNNATEEEMNEVLKKVNLYNFLQNEKGLKTKLLEKASNLSGGQCQRLALARALLHNTPVYIFDEATSNIDMESENDIMKVIHNLRKEKTVILISHRLANVVPSDNIYVLKEGKIVESGNHSELIKNNKFYTKLYNSQMKLENYSIDRREKSYE